MYNQWSERNPRVGIEKFQRLVPRIGPLKFAKNTTLHEGRFISNNLKLPIIRFASAAIEENTSTLQTKLYDFNLPRLRRFFL